MTTENQSENWYDLSYREKEVVRILRELLPYDHLELQVDSTSKVWVIMVKNHKKIILKD